MPARARVQTRRWVAGLIIALFFVAVAGSAAIGWWYARESPPHQGPILLVSMDGVPATDLSAYGAQRSDTPALDALANESVVFERAYTHSPQSLPAHGTAMFQNPCPRGLTHSQPRRQAVPPTSISSLCEKLHQPSYFAAQ